MIEMRDLRIHAIVAFLAFGCGESGPAENEAGVYLAKLLKTHVCQSEVKDFNSPCGSIDVRYKPAPKAVFINVYGIYLPNDISEVITLIKQSKKSKEIQFKVTVTFYRNIGSHSIVYSEKIGE